MTYLLDTHTFLWFLEGNDLLPTNVRKKITDPSNNCFVSIVSLWEIAIKLRIKKLSLKFQFTKIVEYMAELDIKLLPLNFEHTVTLLDLELHHRDPFDNILIAQSISEHMTVITKDANFSLYNISIIWA